MNRLIGRTFTHSGFSSKLIIYDDCMLIEGWRFHSAFNYIFFLTFPSHFLQPSYIFQICSGPAVLQSFPTSKNCPIELLPRTATLLEWPCCDPYVYEECCVRGWWGWWWWCGWWLWWWWCTEAWWEEGAWTGCEELGEVEVTPELLVVDWIVDMLVLELLWLCFVNLNMAGHLNTWRKLTKIKLFVGESKGKCYHILFR